MAPALEQRYWSHRQRCSFDGEPAQSGGGDGEGDIPSVARFSEDLVAISASRRVYDQLRWIDETGIERACGSIMFRISPLWFPRTAQNSLNAIISSRPCGWNGAASTFYPLDLNVEQDRVKRRKAGDPGRYAGERQIRESTWPISSAAICWKSFPTLPRSKDGDVRINLLNRDGYWLRPQSVR